MDREGFRSRMKQYKKAREENPGLKYWEWRAQPAEKDVPKYDGGTGSIGEIPWWQKIINHGEKVQPFTQTDIEQYKNNELQKRLARSKYIMGVLSDIGASGKNPIKALYNPTTGGDQLDVFLLNIKDQQQIMEQRGWKKIDTKKEEDPYGIVRTGANYHLTKHTEVPVYENTFDSDTTITREQLTKLFNVSNDIIPGTNSFGNAGSYSSAIYIDKNTGKFYSRSYDLNDYGPTQLSNGFISTVGDFKRKSAEKLDEIGTPFVIRTGFVPVNDYDMQHIANHNEKYKNLINNAKAGVTASKILKKAEGGEVIGPPIEKHMFKPRKKLIEYTDEEFDTTDRILGMKDIINSEIRKEVNDNSANTNDRLLKLQTLFNIPFVKDKKIKLTNSKHLNGSVLSENLLDSIYKYSTLTGVPLLDALGLAAQETTFGKYEGFMGPGASDAIVYDIEKGGNYGSPDLLLNDHTYMSDSYYEPDAEAYDWFRRRYPKESFELTRSRVAKELESNSNYYINEGVNRYYKTLNPWVHSFLIYKSGKYNTGDKNHTKDVLNAGRLVMLDPAVQKWMKENGIKTSN